MNTRLARDESSESTSTVPIHAARRDTGPRVATVGACVDSALRKAHRLHGSEFNRSCVEAHDPIVASAADFESGRITGI